MKEARQKTGLPRTLGTVALVVVVIAGIRAAAPVVQPLVVALLLALGSLPLLNVLERKLRCPRAVAILLTVGTNVAFLGGLGLAFSKSLQGLSSDLPRYKERFADLERGFYGWLETLGIPMSEVEGSLITVGDVLDHSSRAAGELAFAASRTTLVLLIVVFILVESRGFKRRFDWIMAQRDGDSFSWINDAYRDVQNYLALKTLISAGTGLVAGVLCAILSIPFAPLWAVVAFLLNFIPFIGSVIAAIPAVALAFVDGGFQTALIALIGYVVLNVLFSNVLEPRIFGRATSLSPLVILIMVLFWGWVLGPVGALIAVPIATSTKLLLQRLPEWRWLAVIISARPPPDTDSVPATPGGVPE